MSSVDVWRDALRGVERWTGDVLVVASCGTTMHTAHEHAARTGRSVCAVALEQTAGRGTHGRTWDHAADARGPLGVAMTIALHTDGLDLDCCSIAAGLAACEAANTLCVHPGVFGVKWPNDVVLRSDGRKLAGVLEEVKDGWLLVGVGLNVLHGTGDFPEGAARQRVSLRQAGAANVSTLQAACALLDRLASLVRPHTEDSRACLIERWKTLDVLTGTRRAFIYDNATYEGIVGSIDPLREITLRDDAEQIVRLPTATTALRKEP